MQVLLFCVLNVIGTLLLSLFFSICVFLRQFFFFAWGLASLVTREEMVR
jgi:hypothetical protein